MASGLESLIDSLESARNSLLDGIAGLDERSLASKPSPDKWSILEITEHLVVAERVILKNLPQFEDLVPRPVHLGNLVKYFVVMTVLRFSVPVKVPSRSMNPTGGSTLNGLRQEWDRHLEWLRAYVKEFDAEGDRLAVFVHPVVGPITMVQALRMNLLHVRTHARQINGRKGSGTALEA